MKRIFQVLILLCSSYLVFQLTQTDCSVNEASSDVNSILDHYVLERDSLQQIVNDSIKDHPYRCEYRFWISNLDKALGKRITYEVRDNRLIIKKGPYDFMYFAPNYYADEIIFDTILKPKDQARMNSLMNIYKTVNLKSMYNTTCIIDGLILYFHFELDEENTSTTISNYYLEEVVPVIEFVNSIVPKEFYIDYNKKWLLELQNKCDDIID